MVYKLIALIGLGTYTHSASTGNNIEDKEFKDAIISKTEITRERADAKIKELQQKSSNIIKAFIVQSSKMKLDNGRRQKILATWGGGKWT